MSARLPFSPLLQASGGWTGLARVLGYDGPHELANNTNLYRSVKTGLTWVAADHLACALNLHPSFIWGEAWWECTGPVPGPSPRMRHEPRWGLVRAELEAVA